MNESKNGMYSKMTRQIITVEIEVESFLDFGTKEMKHDVERIVDGYKPVHCEDLDPLSFLAVDVTSVVAR